MPIQIETLPVTTQAQIVQVATLAEEIWREHYTPIIGAAQVDYMLEHFCNEEQIPRVARLLLVSPPSPQCAIENIRKFFPYEIPEDLHADEALLVTSTDDPYLTPDEARMLQTSLGIPMKVLEDAGHINEKSGYGPWPWVLEWVLGRPVRHRSLKK